MFGKKKSKTKPEAAVGVSIKRNSYSEFVNIPRIILPEPETDHKPVPHKEPINVVPFKLESQKPEPRKPEPSRPEISKVEHSNPEPSQVEASEIEPPTVEPSKIKLPKPIASSITYPPHVQSASVPSSPSLDKIKNSRFRVQSASFKSENKVEVNKNESPNNDEDGSISNPDSEDKNGPNITTTNGSGENHEEESSDKEPPLNRIMRRKSVFAEAYNPEEEEEESERIIHAKSDDQRIRLGENVKNIFLFRSLDHDQIGEVLDAMFERKVKENEYVIKQGDDGDNFYVIESGTFNIFVDIDPLAPPKLVGKYENAGSFGELALMYNLPRAATIQAVSSGSLWAMDRQTFRRIVLKAAYKKRKMYESLLEKCPMLKALQNYERMNLADALVPRIKLAGELIIKQGDAADGMYFVEEGSVRVVMVNSDNQEKEISRVNVGGYFGELALVTKKPRAASIFAVDKVRLAFLDVEAFERLLGPCMDIMKRNIEDYENELLRIFGSQANISDIR